MVLGTRGPCRPKKWSQESQMYCFVKCCVFVRYGDWIEYFALQFSKWSLTAVEEPTTAKHKVNVLRNDHHATLPNMSAPVKFSIYHESVHIFWHSLESILENASEKRRLRQSPRDRTGDKGFILKTDYCFHTTQCLAFNPMDHTGWIALLILSFPTATAGSEEAAVWGSSSIIVLHQSRDVNQK